MTAIDVTVFHNPNCSTSRQVVELIRERGVAPRIIDYLKTGWTEPQLRQLLSEMGARPRDILRTKGGLAEEMGLTDPEATEAMVRVAGVEPALLSELDFESSASTNSTTPA